MATTLKKLKRKSAHKGRTKAMPHKARDVASANEAHDFAAFDAPLSNADRDAFLEILNSEQPTAGLRNFVERCKKLR